VCTCIIELGDGQVSDRPATIEASSFLSAILDWN
jgi:hypothetical protein